MNVLLKAVCAVCVVAVVVAIGGAGMGSAPKGDAAPAGAQLAAAKTRLAKGGDMVAEGGREFESEGCDTCHALAATGAAGKLGPRLDTLSDDTVTSIEESITAPRKEIVKGYEGDLMPTDYAKRMKPAEIKAVATFLKAVSGGKQGGDESGDGDEG
ncbi:MAG: c-type cytochrome [Solirubrobacteraceae bacterium]